MRTTPLVEFRASEVAGDGTFAGYASVFDGRPDSFGDVVLPGAFTATLNQHTSAGTSPGLLWAHDVASPICRWSALKEDGRGLRAEGRLSLATPRGRDAYALLKDKAVTGLSIGFSVPEGGARREGAMRVLSQLDLHEISLTPVPSRLNARVTEVRSVSDPREIEDRLREAGFSKRQARIMAHSISSTRNVEPDPSAVADVLKVLEQATLRIKEFSSWN